jgi:DNA-directed RNA polymerase specialized sigma24 family protein
LTRRSIFSTLIGGMGAGNPEVFVEGTISATTLAASGNTLELLPIREALVFLADAKGLAMTQVAGALGITLETAYGELAHAREVVTPAARTPLDRLSTREALVFLARAKGLAITAAAMALGVSLKTAYRDLAHARAVLTPLAPVVMHRPLVDPEMR